MKIALVIFLIIVLIIFTESIESNKNRFKTNEPIYLNLQKTHTCINPVSRNRKHGLSGLNKLHKETQHEFKLEIFDLKEADDSELKFCKLNKSSFFSYFLQQKLECSNKQF